MRRWALVVVALYGLLLVAATCPVLWATFSLTPTAKGTKILPLDEAWGIFEAWPYWAWLGVMLLAQAALLALPVRLRGGRPVTKGPLFSTLLASGLMMGVLGSAYFMAVVSALFGDDGLDTWVLWTYLGIALGIWGAWARVFYRISLRRGPEETVSRVGNFLLAGSVLELLVAVPCHVWVRRKDVCCADGLTFWGIAMGVAVMLFSFGPGVFFLYAERVRRLTPKA